MTSEIVKQRLNAKSQRQNGFSLVELIISVAIFAVVMLLVTGIIVNGLKVRKANGLNTDAQNYVYTVLEQFKSDWTDRTKYEAFDATEATFPGSVNTLLSGIPQDFSTMALDFECVNLDGSVNDCSDTPPLRRISLALTDKSGKVAVELITEIGDPRPGATN